MIPLFKVRMSITATGEVGRVLRSGYIGQGPRVEEFEDKLWEELQSETRPITVNSCTSALDLALELIGVGPGDEVISTPITCFASNSVIINRGAKIVWADVDPITGLIDPSDVGKKITAKTKAIMAVNWAGRLCEFQKLKNFSIPVIEDAAHTWNISHERERGDYVCYSFQAIKFLTSGDGGCLTVPKHKEKEARLLRWYGLDRERGESFRCTQNITRAGFKYHMNDISAAIGLSNIDGARESVNQHIDNASKMSEALGDIDFIVTPPEGNQHQPCAFWLYTTILKGVDRDDFSNYLTKNGIGNSPVHYRNDLYDCTSEFKINLKGVDEFNIKQLSLPIGWWVSEENIQYIANTIKNYE